MKKLSVIFIGAALLFVSCNIEGTITQDGKPLPGVTVALSGDDSKISMTNSDGKYTLSNLGKGTYTITPSMVGYEFNPKARIVVFNQQNQNAVSVDFVALPAKYSCSGKILVDGMPLMGADVVLSGDSNASTITNAEGKYLFTGLPDGEYTITPKNGCNSFSPSSKSVTISSSDMEGVDFDTADCTETLNVTDFFVVSLGDDVSTATDPDNSGTFQTQYIDAQQCAPHNTVIHVMKGGSIPWSSETFYINDGFLKILNENWYSGLKIDPEKYTRTFRDISTGLKGLIWMPEYFARRNREPQPITEIQIPSYAEEYWYNSETGLPSCDSDAQNPVIVTGNYIQVFYVGILWDYMLDYRKGLEGIGRPVEVIQLSHFWGENKENYQYGRVYLDGQWKGVGLIKWEFIASGELQQRAEFKYIVNSNRYIICSTCPDVE